jgi:histidyl-tRNA synthetase
LGESELADGVAAVRSMTGGEQLMVPLNELVEWIQANN